VDIISAERRSALMRRVRQRDTDPELVVRRVAHALGLGRLFLTRQARTGRPAA
jgi:DNA mismatch endonuclease (patch repair protein)